MTALFNKRSQVFNEIAGIASLMRFATPDKKNNAGPVWNRPVEREADVQKGTITAYKCIATCPIPYSGPCN